MVVKLMIIQLIKSNNKNIDVSQSVERGIKECIFIEGLT